MNGRTGTPCGRSRCALDLPYSETGLRELLCAAPVRAEGPAGRLDFKGGPFPERFEITLAPPA